MAAAGAGASGAIGAGHCFTAAVQVPARVYVLLEWGLGMHVCVMLNVCVSVRVCA